MRKNGFKYTTQKFIWQEKPWFLLKEENVIDRSLIDTERRFLVYVTPWGVNLFDRDLIFIDQKCATYMARFCNAFVELDKHILKLSDDRIKHLKPYIKEGTLFVSFRRRFGNILITKGELSVRKIAVTKKFLFSPNRKIKTLYTICHAERERNYIHGDSAADWLITSKNNTVALERMEIFIAEVFKQFKQNNSNMLSGYAFDMIPANCMMTASGFVFFDFEWELKGGIDKSYMIYRIVRWCSAVGRFVDDIAAIYKYFCDKFDVEYKLDWCMDMEFNKSERNVEASPLDNSSKLTAKIFLRFISGLIPHPKTRRKVRDAITKRWYYPYFEIFSTDVLRRLK
jgi:hypothetical protein